MPRKVSLLQYAWDSLFLDIDQKLQDPVRLSSALRERIRAQQARADFTQATLYPHKVLTAHDRVITPYRIDISAQGGLHSNLTEFMSQPRIAELRQQMLCAEQGGLILLDEQQGNFYHEQQPHQRLGTIDLQTERMLFSHAAQSVRLKYLFGDARQDNPICFDTTTGAIYPQKNPAAIRGHARLKSFIENAP